ncbi:MAG TPA: hypothetical protein VFD27_14135 [Chthoniobacteraceae bacterium]|nr:hypothetical protein [Chthoniobacteraceae bacterium]
MTEGKTLAVQGLADRAFLFRSPGDEFDAAEAFPAQSRDFFHMKIVAEMSQGMPFFRSLVIEERIRIGVTFRHHPQDCHLRERAGGLAVDTQPAFRHGGASGLENPGMCSARDCMGWKNLRSATQRRIGVNLETDAC